LLKNALARLLLLLLSLVNPMQSGTQSTVEHTALHAMHGMLLLLLLQQVCKYIVPMQDDTRRLL
jgi:cytochrome b561